MFSSFFDIIVSRSRYLGEGASIQLEACSYLGGGVEKNERKEVYHLEEAAIGGDAFARHNLGCADLNNCRIDRAVKHYIIAATLGNDSHWIP